MRNTLLQKLLIGALIIAGLVALYLPDISRYRRLETKYREVRQEMKKLEEENRLLEEQNRLLKSDSFYIEKTAREKMGITRKGEIPYRIVVEE